MDVHYYYWTLFSELIAQRILGLLAHRTIEHSQQTYPLIPEEIHIHGNNINSFPYNEFDKFYQLERLNIGFNPFTQLPNITPVGDTLKVLWMAYCKLTELNASILNELVVLEQIHVHHCPFTSFPDVGGPGNTLWVVYCDECKLTTFPQLSNY